MESGARVRQRIDGGEWRDARPFSAWLRGMAANAARDRLDVSSPREKRGRCPLPQEILLAPLP